MRQLRSSHSSYNQAYSAVTINDLFPVLTVTMNSPKFSPPEICNIRRCCCGFSRRKKIDPMTLRGCNIGGERGAVLTQSAIVWTHHVGSPPFWLIVTALDRNGYLPVFSQGDVRRRFAKFIVNMFFCLSLCLSATLRKISFTDFNQIFSIDPTWDKEESAKFWGCYN